MALVIGCANQDCKQPFSFMLDETLGGARCPYCGAISTVIPSGEPRSMERFSVLVQEPDPQPQAE
jgi:hypothetical protein